MRRVQCQLKSNVIGDRDLEMSSGGSISIFNTGEVAEVADFELGHRWDEG